MHGHVSPGLRNATVVIIVLCTLGWLTAPPILLFWGAITGAGFFGEVPSPEEQVESAFYLSAAALLAVGLSGVAMIMAFLARWRVVGAVYAVLLGVSILGAVLIAADLSWG